MLVIIIIIIMIVGCARAESRAQPARAGFELARRRKRNYFREPESRSSAGRAVSVWLAAAPI